ncbi:aconitate hydratase 1, partial [Alcaligenes faecalis subsp. faecalis NCIB 8687]
MALPITSCTSAAEVQEVIGKAIASEMYRDGYADVFAGDERWRSLPTPKGDRFEWQDDSTYVGKPPYFIDLKREPSPVADIRGARVLANLGDSVTTAHISPAGSIARTSPAATYLMDPALFYQQADQSDARRARGQALALDGVP